MNLLLDTGSRDGRTRLPTNTGPKFGGNLILVPLFDLGDRMKTIKTRLSLKYLVSATYAKPEVLPFPLISLKPGMVLIRSNQTGSLEKMGLSPPKDNGGEPGTTATGRGKDANNLEESRPRADSGSPDDHRRLARATRGRSSPGYSRISRSNGSGSPAIWKTRSTRSTSTSTLVITRRAGGNSPVAGDVRVPRRLTRRSRSPRFRSLQARIRRATPKPTPVKARWHRAARSVRTCHRSATTPPRHSRRRKGTSRRIRQGTRRRIRAPIRTSCRLRPATRSSSINRPRRNAGDTRRASGQPNAAAGPGRRRHWRRRLQWTRAGPARRCRIGAKVGHTHEPEQRHRRRRTDRPHRRRAVAGTSGRRSAAARRPGGAVWNTSPTPARRDGRRVIDTRHATSRFAERLFQQYRRELGAPLTRSPRVLISLRNTPLHADLGRQGFAWRLCFCLESQSRESEARLLKIPARAPAAGPVQSRRRAKKIRHFSPIPHRICRRLT